MLMKLPMLANFLRKNVNKTLINIGSPVEMSIKNYANLIKNKVDPKNSNKIR